MKKNRSFSPRESKNHRLNDIDRQEEDKLTDLEAEQQVRENQLNNPFYVE